MEDLRQMIADAVNESQDDVHFIVEANENKKGNENAKD